MLDDKAFRLSASSCQQQILYLYVIIPGKRSYKKEVILNLKVSYVYCKSFIIRTGDMKLFTNGDMSKIKNLCTFCGKDYSENNMIQCISFSLWPHCKSTKLQRYILYSLINSRRKYTCQQFIIDEIPENFWQPKDKNKTCDCNEKFKAQIDMLNADILSKHKNIENLHVRNDNLQTNS